MKMQNAEDKKKGSKVDREKRWINFKETDS